MKYRHTNRPGFLLGFIDFFTVGIFFLIYMPAGGLQDEIESVLGHKVMPYDDVLIMADPYDVTDHYQDGYYTVPFGRFFSMWYEGACTGKTAPYHQPFVIAVPNSDEGNKPND